MIRLDSTPDRLEIGDIFLVQLKPNDVLSFSNSRKIIDVRYEDIKLETTMLSILKKQWYIFKQYSAHSWILDRIETEN